MCGEQHSYNLPGSFPASEVRAKYSVKHSAEQLEAVLREVTSAAPAGSVRAEASASSEAEGPANAAKEERARAAR